MKVKHTTSSGIRQIITSPNGGRATLIVTGKKARIEHYKPSREYMDHVMGKVTTIHISQLGKPKERFNLVRKRTHLQLINRYLGPLFDLITDPEAKDTWMDNTPARQFACYGTRRPSNG